MSNAILDFVETNKDCKVLIDYMQDCRIFCLTLYKGNYKNRKAVTKEIYEQYGENALKEILKHSLEEIKVVEE